MSKWPVPGPNNKQVVVFREGDVLVREGARNTPLRHAHWNDLLSLRDQQVREQARVQVDSLIADLAAAMRAVAPGPPRAAVRRDGRRRFRRGGGVAFRI